MGLRPSGKTISIQVMDIFRIADGKTIAHGAGGQHEDDAAAWRDARAGKKAPFTADPATL